jgi:hypothetical protein
LFCLYFGRLYHLVYALRSISLLIPILMSSLVLSIFFLLPSLCLTHLCWLSLLPHLTTPQRCILGISQCCSCRDICSSATRQSSQVMVVQYSRQGITQQKVDSIPVYAILIVHSFILLPLVAVASPLFVSFSCPVCLFFPSPPVSSSLLISSHSILLFYDISPPSLLSSSLPLYRQSGRAPLRLLQEIRNKVHSARLHFGSRYRLIRRRDYR